MGRIFRVLSYLLHWYLSKAIIITLYGWIPKRDQIRLWIISYHFIFWSIPMPSACWFGLENQSCDSFLRHFHYMSVVTSRCGEVAAQSEENRGSPSNKYCPITLEALRTNSTHYNSSFNVTRSNLAWTYIISKFNKYTTAMVIWLRSPFLHKNDIYKYFQIRNKLTTTMVTRLS